MKKKNIFTGRECYTVTGFPTENLVNTVVILVYIMPFFMQAVRLLPCSLIFTQRLNEVVVVKVAAVCCLGGRLSCKLLWETLCAFSVR